MFCFSNKCKQNCHSQLTKNRLWEFPFYRITVLQSTKTFAFKTCTFTHTIKQFFCRYIYSTFLSLLHYSLCSPCFLFSSHASFRHCFIRRFAQCDVTVPEFGIRLSGIRHELHNHETPLFPQYTQISPIWKQFYTHRSLVLLVV